MALNVLVTGAAGRLGREVCKALSDAGYDVRATDRAYGGGTPVRLELADLLDGQGVYRLLEGRDAVVHLANYPNVHSGVPVQQLYRENVAMDVNVFQAAVDLGIRKLVFSSSVQVFAGDRSLGWGEEADDALKRPSCLAYLPIDGDAPTCPRNLYALSKEAGEQMLRYYAALDADLSATAVRYPFLVSPRHLGWFRRHAGDRRHLHGNPDEGFSFLFLDDAASLVAAILDRQPPGYYQLFPASPKPSTDVPVGELIERWFPGVPLRKPVEELTGLVDIARITEALGWQPEHTDLLAES